MFAINTNANTIKVARELASQLQNAFTLEADIYTGAQGDFVTVEGKNYGSFVTVTFKHNKADSYTLHFKSRQEQCHWLRKELEARC